MSDSQDLAIVKSIVGANGPETALFLVLEHWVGRLFGVNHE